MDDSTAWADCNPDHLWIYDKLILSRKLGYTCGPVGVPVPTPGTYIVRPITNLEGMSVGASLQYIEDKCDKIVPPGHFWCEVFTGRHLSVDYVDQQPVLTVEGFKEPNAPIYKWSKWKKVDHSIPFPSVLADLPYRHINCEFIGGKLIEAHLRDNPDFRNDFDELIPVWEGEDTTPPSGMVFIESKDFKRVGFFAKV